MKKIKVEDNSVVFSNIIDKKRFTFVKRFKLLYNKNFFLIFLLFIVNDFIIYKIFLLAFNNSNPQFKTNNSNDINNITIFNKSNIDDDEFFKRKEVILKIKQKKLTNVETIAGGHGHLGNALLMLNNLINICINIKCKNIISPGGLNVIIKKPIFLYNYNITIFPNKFKNLPNIDILLSKRFIFWFHYKTKPHENRLKVIRNEVINNIPKYDAHPNDLYINIRSGDVFLNKINPMYSQPPLCFYQKIINENNFSNIYILSNGHENPVVDELLKLYPKIKYIHGNLEYDISVVINAYNFVLPISTFSSTLINFNNNLKHLYIYEILKRNFNFQNISFTIHIMASSVNYRQIMERKWKNSKEQLNLMLTEDCINSKMDIIFNEQK